MESKKTMLFLVEDDQAFIKSFKSEFPDDGEFFIKIFPTGELCLESIHEVPDIVLMGYSVDVENSHTISAMETMNKIKAVNIDIPVVILSKRDKKHVAKICFQNGAFDYVVKSETALVRIQNIISIILKIHKLEKELKWYMDRM